VKAVARYFSLGLALALLLAACSTLTSHAATPSAGFLFTVDTNMQSIALENPSTVGGATSDGVFTKDFAGGNDAALAVAIDQDNKIVVAGFAEVSGNGDFAVARFLP